MSDSNETMMHEIPKKKKTRAGGFFRGLLLLVLLLFAAGFGFRLGRTTLIGKSKTGSEKTSSNLSLDSDSIDKKLELFQAYVNEFYLNDINPSKVEDGIYKGFVSGLEDPYAEYYSPDEYRQLMDEDSGQYKGIGVTVMKDTATGYVLVESVFENQPAARAGIQTGDLITSVNGRNTLEMELTEVVMEIKNKNRKDADIKIVRDGKILDFKVVKSDIVLDTVEYSMKKDQVGYIKITEFIENTDEEFIEAVDELQKEKMKGLIIDLRNNGGGLLDSCVNIVSRIIPADKLIVYTENKKKERQEFNSNSKKTVDVPIVILTNGNTASASEILTGCLQDYSKATIIGTKTYGKGIVQNILPLSDGSALKFTISKYYTPKGQDIHEKGIEPDKKIEMTDEELKEARQDESRDTQLEEAIDQLD